MKKIETQLKKDATARDLLPAIDRRLAADASTSEQDRLNRMRGFEQTVNHIALCLSTNTYDLTVKHIFDSEIKFLEYVRGLSRSGGDKADHLARREQMIHFARQEGWTCASLALEDEWSEPRRAVKGRPPGKSIIDDAIHAGMHTWEVSDTWLARRAGKQVGKKRRYRYAATAQSAFRTAINLAKLQHLFPLLTFAEPIQYRMPVRALPKEIRREIAAILWNMRREGRLCGARLARSVARGVVFRFQELCGYVMRVRKVRRVRSMKQLLTPNLIRNYVSWLQTEHGCGVRSISAHVNRIKNVMRYHPVLGNEDFSWIKLIVEEFSDPEDDQFIAGADDRVVLGSDLRSIAGKIRQKRLKEKGSNKRLEAYLVMLELLMLWMLTQPWPPACIRNCRINGTRRNLLFDVLPTGGPPFALTPAAEKAWRKNQYQRFWQYFFGPIETPDHRLARGLVVRRLLPLLKVYLDKYRSVLIGSGNDPGTLFVNYAGQKFQSGQFAELIGEICQEHVGARLTPNEIRRIYGFDWLLQHKNDPRRYEKLSIILWMSYPGVMKQFASAPTVRFPRRNSPRRGFLSLVHKNAT